MSLNFVTPRYAGIAHGIGRLNATPGRDAAPERVRSSISDHLSARDMGCLYYSTLLGLGR